ncbi:hypothetical protein [Nocardia vermiculata]|uniref:hypothetical protein n=1 Tax=Nocardia vermiculata TaxID=257274 RepID=UPI000830C826|nr:hypothetical protein [Nocardia vermiculata]
MTAPAVKCLVWELDNTVWDGVVCDSTSGGLRTDGVRALHALTGRGVVHAVASRGEWSWTVEKLDRHGLRESFAVVEVGWGRKSSAITRIAQRLRIDLDAIGYIDAEAMERSEVAHALPQVRCYAGRHVDVLSDLQEFRAPCTAVPPPTSPMGFAHIRAN